MRLSNIFFRVSVYILFCILFVQLGVSDYCHAAGLGTTSADFLRIPVGARETALGGTFSAVSDNSNAVYYNPAGLGLIKQSEVSFTYNKYLEGITQQWLSFAYPTSLGTLGLGLNYLSVSPFDSYDDFDNRTGFVSAADMAVFLSYGVTIPLNYKLISSLSGGISAKYISQRLDEENGYGNAFDAGLLAVSGLENLKLSFGIDNFSSNEIKFIDEKAELPMIYKAGISYNLTSPDSPVAVLISAQDNFPKGGKDYFSVGMENILYGIFALRVGYSSYGNISNPVTFGFGLDLGRNTGGNVRLDYSYGISDYFGNIQKITLAYKFGRSSGDFLKNEKADKEEVVELTQSKEIERKEIIVVSTEPATLPPAYGAIGAITKDASQVGGRAISTPLAVVVSTENPLADYYLNIISLGDLSKSLGVIAELGANKSDYSIRFLLDLVDNENSSVALAALHALKDFNDSDIIIKILSVKNEDMRAKAISYLKGYKGDKILEVLKTALYDESSKIREKAATALGDYGEKSAMNFLIYALKNERDEYVMSAIIKSLSVLSAIVKDEQ